MGIFFSSDMETNVDNKGMLALLNRLGPGRILNKE